MKRAQLTQLTQLSHPALGWLLALAAFVAGYVGYGWPGVALAFTATVFWLLLQFSRALRALRAASAAPVGTVANAVMLQARLQTGMRMSEVLKLTRSLGQRVAPAAAAEESWVWSDAGGDRVCVVLSAGRVVRWSLQRAAAT